MANKLPKKLTLLRKHYGYSQGDIANKLHIPVTEYMNWENGNTVCGIQQLKVLAGLFHVSLDAMADNSKDIVIPDDNMGDSVNIPFLNGANSSMTQQMDVADNMMPVSSVLPADTQENTLQVSRLDGENLGSTKQMSTVADAIEQPKDTVKPSPAKLSKKDLDKKKKKKTMIIIGSVCGAAILVVLLIIMILKPGSGSVAVGSYNRLAEGDKFTLYVDSKGSLKTNGQFSSSDFSSIVQVSAYGGHAVGLTEKGKVVTTDDSTAVADWSDITMVAAGKDHTVGLKKDGTVVCTGNDKACAVSDWSDIKAVYAGNNITIGLRKDGSLATSGSVNSAISNQSSVVSISMNDDILVITKEDGTVSSYAIGSKQIMSTSGFSKITCTAVGSDAVIGLKSDGTIAIATDNDDLKKAVAEWKNIKYIAAYNKTYVAVDSSGTLYGAGDNTYNQYNAIIATTASTTKLSTPKNIQTELSTANLTIKWDSVENANYYQVTVTGMDTIKAANNSTSVPTTSLTDGKDYTITVIACSDKPETHPNSDPAEYKYTYKSLSQKLEAPANIASYPHTEMDDEQWIIHWDTVSNADYYIVNVDDGQDQKTTSNSIAVELAGTQISETSPTHNIRVKAYSNSTAYTESDSTKTTLSYDVKSYSKKITITFSGNSYSYTKVFTLIDGTHKISTLWGIAQLEDEKNGSKSYSLTSEFASKVLTVDDGTSSTQTYTVTSAQPQGQN